MAPPPVTIYVTSLTSAPKVRQHIELLRRSLKGWEIPYQEFDLVNDEEAKKRWQRAKPSGQVIGLPGYLVGGEFIGTMDDFDDAVETQTLPAFLKQDLDLDLGAASGAAGADGAGGAKNMTVGEAELEKLMRGMTTEELDALASEIGVGEGAGKVGLMVPAGEEAAAVDGGAEDAGKMGAAAAAKEEGVAASTADAEGVVEAPDESAAAGEENLKEVVHDAAVALGEGLGVSSGGTERQADEVGKGESVDELLASKAPAQGKEKVD